MAGALHGRDARTGAHTRVPGEGGGPGRLWVSRALTRPSAAVPGASAGRVGCGGWWTIKRLCGCAWSLRKARPLCRAARLGAGTRGRGALAYRGGSYGSRALTRPSAAVPGASAGRVGCGGWWTTKRLCGCAWSLRKARPLCRVARLGAGTRGRGTLAHRGASFVSRALTRASAAVAGASAGRERGRVVVQ